LQYCCLEFLLQAMHCPVISVGQTFPKPIPPDRVSYNGSFTSG
jgi:hypothetical protein